jgi:hypothetical protein
MSQWVNESMSQWVNESMSQWFNESMSQWFNESMIQRVNESTSQWVNESMSQWVNESTNLKDENHKSNESPESYESDREQAFPQEYSSNGNSVLVPNNSQDQTCIYDFSNGESVKTIIWYQFIHVFSMFLHCSFDVY